MSVHQKCANCYYFDDATGWCRRYPPQVYHPTEEYLKRVGIECETGSDADYPLTADNEWCGEWRSICA